MPGFAIQNYVSGISNPYRLAFSPAGVLFVGNNSNQAPEWVLRVPVGGGSFSTYGTSPCSDPDAVAFDVTGSISGTPGSVLVGRGNSPTPDDAYLTAILPNQTVINLEGPTSLLGNLEDLVFDRTGRLLISDYSVGNILVRIGGPSTVLFTIPSVPIAIAVDENNRIYTSAEDGIIRVHAANGSLLNASFLTGLVEAPLACGPGGDIWGTDLYCVNNSTGSLIRVTSDGITTLIGTGFGMVGDIGFGPDSVLYLSMYDEGLVLKITPSVPLGVPGLESASKVMFTSGPNPARGPVHFHVMVPVASAGVLSVISIDGRLVQTIHRGQVQSGQSSWAWDRRDAGGRMVAPGIYFARFVVGQDSMTRRIALVE